MVCRRCCCSREAEEEPSIRPPFLESFRRVISGSELDAWTLEEQWTLLARQVIFLARHSSFQFQGGLIEMMILQSTSRLHGGVGVPVIYHHRPPMPISLFPGPISHYPPHCVPAFRVVRIPISRRETLDPVEIRQVCRYNLKTELTLIRSLIRSGFRVASFDTEFPGTVVPPKVPIHMMSQADPAVVYEMMKANVDKTRIIQLGLSLSDPRGNLPVCDGSYCCWEFNFSDFDVDCDDHVRNSDSIDLLRRQGIDFAENKVTGICSADFAKEIERSGLVHLLPCLTWVTFQCAYDFGYLVKIFTGNRKLPEDINEFMGKVKDFFGGQNVYDIKYMMKFCDGLFGGLDRVAEKLGVGRVAGSSHQAGSDSLLTLQTFLKILKVEKNRGNDLSQECGGVLFGLGSLV